MYYFSEKVAPILELNSGEGFEATKKLLVENNQPPTGLWKWIGINPPRSALMQWDNTNCILRIRIESSWYYNGGKDWLSGLLRAQYCTNKWGEVVEGRRFFGFSPKGGGSWIFCFPNDKFKPAEEPVQEVAQETLPAPEMGMEGPEYEANRIGTDELGPSMAEQQEALDACLAKKPKKPFVQTTRLRKGGVKA